MQLTILNMLSTGSLSAFTASFTDAASVGAARPVREARDAGRQGQDVPSGPTVAPTGPLTPRPGVRLPRGSIVDLSV